MMRIILKSKVLHLSLLTLMVFAMGAIALDPLSLYLLTGAVLMVTSVVAVAMYWPIIYYTLKTDMFTLDRTEILTFGIVLLFAGTAFREWYITIWREFFPLGTTRTAEYFYPLAFIRYTCIVAS